ncbi:MAG: xanthine dehydrogenase family protein molybdopterin-binding subunit [Chloroflexi bacterium]|nr:xanthine dehydrogenase family protein molybdopterin-binding subunit [Chloroflexota bacterium]
MPRIVGQSVPRVDGALKVTGRARYVGDIARPGMLMGGCARSVVPHALIRQIDVSAARRLPGVRAVLTAQDIPSTLGGRRLRDMPVLARDRVRFVGERVAAIAAESSEALQEAISLVTVEYDELPAVFDPLEAMESTAPVLHPELDSYLGLPPGRPDIPNVLACERRQRGDVERAFDGAFHVRTDEFSTQTIHHGYMETHACFAEFDENGRYRVWLTNKMPFAARGQLAAVLGIEERQIVVEPAPIGGDFGGKGSLMDLPLACHLARATGAPLRMTMSYAEELEAANPRHPSRLTITSAVDRDGRIVARTGRVVFDSGAYGAFKPRPDVNLGGGLSLVGLYRMPNFQVEILMVYTNNVPRGHLRSPGEPQAIFALESHTDLLARDLGMDPLEFRRLNARRDGDLDTAGHTLHASHSVEALDAAARAIGWGDKREAGIGRGVALAEHHTGTGESSARLQLDADGGVTVWTAMPDTGTGAHTVMQQVVAEELGAPVESVRIHPGGTDDLPTDSGAGGSRVTSVAGRAAQEVGRRARQQLLSLLAESEGWPEDRLMLEDGLISVEGEPGTRLSFAQAASSAVRTNGGPIVVEHTFVDNEGSHVATVAVQAAEVAVDRETGQVSVRKVVTVHDPSTIVHPVAHQGQVEGGMVQALGYAVMEELVADEGRITTLNLADYRLPTSADLPELETVLLPGSDGPGPFEAKSIGETSNIPLPAAIANAVDDAIGVRLKSLPITAERVWQALQQRA